MQQETSRVGINDPERRGKKYFFSLGKVHENRDENRDERGRWLNEDDARAKRIIIMRIKLHIITYKLYVIIYYSHVNFVFIWSRI